MKPLLGPVVGAVTQTNARVWIFWDNKEKVTPTCRLYSDADCQNQISSIPFQTVSDSPHSFADIEGVAGVAEVAFPPGNKVYGKVVLDEESEVFVIRPFPVPGEDVGSLSFALISCHHPSHPGQPDKTVSSMWSFMDEEMLKQDSRFLIQAGDQVYCDHKKFNAWKWSLKETSEESKRLWYYRQAYINSWNYPEIQGVFRRHPQYMIWDDHEVTNGWGSERRHARSPFKDIFKVARQAYEEFQHCHNPDALKTGELYYGFFYGPAAFLVLDLRGHRDISLYDPDQALPSSALMGEEQWRYVETWLQGSQASKMLFVVTSVPVCHLSRKFGSLGIFKNDVNDQWSTKYNKEDRRRLLRLLYDWSGSDNKPVFILGGDVHVGTVATITDLNSGHNIYQITSSPITNKPAYFLDLLMAKCSSRFQFNLSKTEGRPVEGKIIHRYRKRNFAIINADFNEARVVLNMFEEGKQDAHRLQLYPQVKEQS